MEPESRLIDVTNKLIGDSLEQFQALDESSRTTAAYFLRLKFRGIVSVAHVQEAEAEAGACCNCLECMSKNLENLTKSPELQRFIQNVEINAVVEVPTNVEILEEDSVILRTYRTGFKGALEGMENTISHSKGLGLWDFGRLCLFDTGTGCLKGIIKQLGRECEKLSLPSKKVLLVSGGGVVVSGVIGGLVWWKFCKNT